MYFCIYTSQVINLSNMATALNRKLIFELPKKEQEQLFKSALNPVLKKAAAMNLPVVYRNELCTQRNYFIYEYPTGQKELIEQDIHTSAERIIQVISK